MRFQPKLTKQPLSLFPRLFCSCLSWREDHEVVEIANGRHVASIKIIIKLMENDVRAKCGERRALRDANVPEWEQAYEFTHFVHEGLTMEIRQGRILLNEHSVSLSVKIVR